MSKVIVHIDLNMFFVRCEEIKDPSLVGKCVAIGHEGRSGIVSTCSYEARKYGVHSGMPMFQATKACKNLIIIPGDYKFYRVMSHSFISFLKRYTKLIEQASIDECYCDFTEQLKGKKDIIQYFKDLQNSLYKETGLMCSIGVAPTKFLAKMGSDYKKPMGITIIRKRDIPTILYPLDISQMFGVGKKSVPRLKKLGINTIGDLKKRMDEHDKDVFNSFGKFYSTLEDWLNGKGDDMIDMNPWDPKSIGNSTTLPHDTDDINEIKEYFYSLCMEVSKRAQDEDKIGSTIQIVVKDVNFVSKNKSITMDAPTNSFKTIYANAVRLYEENFSGTQVRLVGVTLQNLVSKRDMTIQMTLFNYEEHESESQTKLLINELNRKLKKPSLKRASELEEDKK